MSKKLLSLAGMVYRQGMPVSYWRDKTGTDPRTVPEIKITDSGVCLWTTKAEKAYRSYMSEVKSNWNSIGINN